MLTIYNGHYRTPEASGVRHYIQLELELLQHLKEFTPSELMVMVALGLHIDQRGYCFPSVSRLHECTGLTAPTIRSAIKGLTEKQINMRPVLLMRERKASTGRQTSNEYIVFPQDANAFNAIDEGVNNLPVTSKFLVPLEQETNKPIKRKRSHALPSEDDPAYLLWLSFVETVNPFGEHNLLTGEWNSVKFILYQMHKQGVTPTKIAESTQNLLSQWGAEYVTIHSLWKHWAKAQAPATKPKAKARTTVEQADTAMSIMARVNQIMGVSDD